MSPHQLHDARVDRGPDAGGCPGAITLALRVAVGAQVLHLVDRHLDGQVQARRWLGSRPQLPALFVVDRDGAVGAMAGACGPEAVTSLRAAIENALAR